MYLYTMQMYVSMISYLYNFVSAYKSQVNKGWYTYINFFFEHSVIQHKKIDVIYKILCHKILDQ